MPCMISDLMSPIKSLITSVGSTYILGSFKLTVVISYYDGYGYAID